MLLNYTGVARGGFTCYDRLNLYVETVADTTFTAFVPTLKMMTSIGVGFGLAKSGIFPPQAAKGVSVVTMVSAHIPLSGMHSAETLSP